MDVKTTLKAIVEGLEPAREFTDMEMDVKLSYRLAKLLRKADTELRDFYAVRDKMISDGGQFSTDQLEQLLDEEVILSNVQPLTVEEVYDNFSKLKPKYFMAMIGWAIIDGNES
jgi:hypothetical protein